MGIDLGSLNLCDEKQTRFKLMFEASLFLGY